MRSLLPLLLLLLATPASAASLADLVDNARAGKLDERERELVRSLLTDATHAPPAAALLLADSEARADADQHCRAAEVLQGVAPEPWAAEALVEQAKCSLRAGRPADAAEFASQALRSPSGFRGGTERALLAADLVARARTGVVALKAKERAASEVEVAAAERAWQDLVTRAGEAGDVQSVNRARRLLGDLHGFRLNPVHGFQVAEAEILGFPAGAGPWLALPAASTGSADAPQALADLGPRGFRDAKWGASQKAVVKAEGRKPVDADEGRLVFEDRLSGREAAVIYTFGGGRLSEGAYVIREPYRSVDDALEHYRSLRKLLRSKYGEPLRNEEVRWGRDGDGDDGRRGLMEGEASYQTSWAFERTTIELRLKRKRGEYKLRLVYTSVDEARRSEERKRKGQEKRESRDLDKL